MKITICGKGGCGKSTITSLLAKALARRGKAMGTVMTQFVQNLRLAENQFALLDMEAGVEHFGRGIDNGVDLVLMIVDPSYESLQLSRKVGELAESIGKPFYYIFNKVTEDNREMMYENVWKTEQVAVCLEADPKIMNEGLTGKELSEKPEPVEYLAEFLLSLV